MSYWVINNVNSTSLDVALLEKKKAVEAVIVKLAAVVDLSVHFLTSLSPSFVAWKPSFENIFFGPFYLFKGIQARLPCQPPAKPYPTIKWFKDGVALEYENNGSYILDSDGTLVIRKVGDSDAGRYTCTAENYLGEATATADGIILGKESSKTNHFLFFCLVGCQQKV